MARTHILTAGLCPLTEHDWSCLDAATEPGRLTFHELTLADSQWQHQAWRAAIISDDRRQSTIENTTAAHLVLALIHRRLRSFWQTQCGLRAPVVLRAQAHLLKTGCFIGAHIDNCYDERYLFSVVFHFQQAYEGGALVLDDGTVCHSNEACVVVLPGDIGHRVDTVTAGGGGGGGGVVGGGK